MNKRRAVRVILFITGILGLIWFFIPFLLGLINIGSATGVFIFTLLTLYAIFFDKTNLLIVNLFRIKWGKILLSVLSVCVAFVLATALFLSALMICANIKQPEKNSTVIILGCRVYGERPSLMLKERLNAAYKYLSENPNSNCVLSGGKGKGENITEAECMRRYLVDKGISENRLYLEEKSTSTRENLKYSLEIIKENSLGENIAVVTNEFHQYRALKIAEKLDIKTAPISAKTALYLFPTYTVREMYGILYEFVF